MTSHNATEQAYKNGYEAGYKAGMRSAGGLTPGKTTTVEVVRCKDCKYYREGKIFDGIKFCFRLRGSNGEPVGYNFSDNDFCSRGERKNDV